MSTQFIRIQPVAYNRAAAILGEADRQPKYCSHIEAPEQPKWAMGSVDSVNARMREVMDRPCTVRTKDGKVRERKRRFDFQCVLAGVIGWPMSTAEFASLDADDKERERKRLLGCFKDSCDWLRRKYGNKLAGIVGHFDEEHPHLHFYVVGECRELHPGLRAEYVEGVRISSRAEKVKRYTAAMRKFLDEYHAEVGQKYGLARAERDRSLPRIQDRAVALRILELEKQVRTAEELRVLDEIARDAQQRNRRRPG